MVRLINLGVSTSVGTASSGRWLDPCHGLLSFVLDGRVESVASLHVLDAAAVRVNVSLVLRFLLLLLCVWHVGEFDDFLLPTRLSYSYWDSMLHLRALLCL